jgi:hypothetical protein
LLNREAKSLTRVQLEITRGTSLFTGNPKKHTTPFTKSKNTPISIILANCKKVWPAFHNPEIKLKTPENSSIVIFILTRKQN